MGNDTTIGERIESITRRVAAVAGERRQSITLIAVSKQQSSDSIRSAIDSGHGDFGENRMDEINGKWHEMKQEHPHVVLHHIGALQRRQVKKIMGVCDVIHAFDRHSLIEPFVRERDGTGRNPSLFVQVNAAAETQKAGIAPQDAPRLIDAMRSAHLPIVGLMCLPPIGQGKRYFNELAQLAKRCHLSQLSMGMSNDFEDAINAGATHIRIGTAIFGERK